MSAKILALDRHDLPADVFVMFLSNIPVQVIACADTVETAKTMVNKTPVTFINPLSFFIVPLLYISGVENVKRFSTPFSVPRRLTFKSPADEGGRACFDVRHFHSFYDLRSDPSAIRPRTAGLHVLQSVPSCPLCPAADRNIAGRLLRFGPHSQHGQRPAGY